jgi:hypothetical protein
MSDFVRRTAAVIQLRRPEPKPVEAQVAPSFDGTITSAVSAPTDGYIQTLTFLDKLGCLNQGDSMVSALAKCGIVRCNQDDRSFRVLPKGLFAGGVVSAQGKALLNTLAVEGFEGDVKYAVNGCDQSIVLTRDGIRDSHELISMRFA